MERQVRVSVVTLGRIEERRRRPARRRAEHLGGGDRGRVGRHRGATGRRRFAPGLTSRKPARPMLRSDGAASPAAGGGSRWRSPDSRPQPRGNARPEHRALPAAAAVTRQGAAETEPGPGFAEVERGQSVRLLSVPGEERRQRWRPTSAPTHGATPRRAEAPQKPPPMPRRRSGAPAAPSGCRTLPPEAPVRARTTPSLGDGPRAPAHGRDRGARRPWGPPGSCRS